MDHAADDASIESFTVVTTEANEYQADYHDRMPVILDRDEEREWLADPDPALLDPDVGDRRAYPVSTAVNDPSIDSPAVVEPVDG